MLSLAINIFYNLQSIIHLKLAKHLSGLPTLSLILVTQAFTCLKCPHYFKMSITLKQVFTPQMPRLKCSCLCSCFLTLCGYKLTAATASEFLCLNSLVSQFTLRLNSYVSIHFASQFLCLNSPCVSILLIHSGEAFTVYYGQLNQPEPLGLLVKF